MADVILAPNLTESRGCLYRLTFPNGKSYIGVTKNSATRRFAKHVSVSESNTERSFLVHRAILKYGASNVVVETLAVGVWHYLMQLEVRAIAAFNTKAPNGYNIADGGQGRVGVKASEETLIRMRAAQRGRTVSDETRARISASKSGKKQSADAIAARAKALKGHAVSAQTRAKLSAANKGHPVSAEQREKLSAAGMGNRHTAETRAKMSASRMGMKISPETLAKLIAANTGRIKTDEERAKISASLKGKKPSAETIAKRAATRAANKLKQEVKP